MGGRGLELNVFDWSYRNQRCLRCAEQLGDAEKRQPNSTGPVAVAGNSLPSVFLQ